MHKANISQIETHLPLGAYLLYPSQPKFEDEGGKEYWPSLRSQGVQSPIWLALDYGETMQSSNFYDDLTKLQKNKTQAKCQDLQISKRITCKAFIGPAMVEGRIKVYLNGIAQWFPVGSVVADLIVHDLPDPHVACPSLRPGRQGDPVPWAMSHLPQLRRTFGARTSVAVAEPPSAILCLPLISGDQLTW